MKKTLTSVLIPFIAFLSFLLGSCKKEANFSRPISFVAVYNATTNPLSFEIGGESENSSAITAGGASAYIGVYEGPWNYLATLASDPPVTATANVNLVGNEHQSIFVLRSDSLEFFTLKDDLSIRNPNRALVRFINLSPDAADLTLQLVLLDTSPTFEHVAFKAPTPYQEFDEKTSYTVTLRNGLTGTDVLPETSYTFERGKMYTIWASGNLAGTTPADRIKLTLTEMR
ncbi:DUF4397 domain-containing protein [Pedobacter sp. SAFR-022]|uniref:DUF4397 domain-containing protein n=1 Tax=Pedobacter sp. SAFR-022 TaxID=3436861 RepID=UPI003F7EACEB